MPANNYKSALKKTSISKATILIPTSRLRCRDKKSSVVCASLNWEKKLITYAPRPRLEVDEADVVIAMAGTNHVSKIINLLNCS